MNIILMARSFREWPNEGDDQGSGRVHHRYRGVQPLCPARVALDARTLRRLEFFRQAERNRDVLRRPVGRRARRVVVVDLGAPRNTSVTIQW